MKFAGKFGSPSRQKHSVKENTCRQQRKFQLASNTRSQITGVLFTLPVLIGLVWLFIYPMLSSLFMSFSDVSFEAGVGQKQTFVGLTNYYHVLFEYPNFNRLALTSLWDTAKQAPVIVLFSFFAASLINQKFRGRALARFFFFLPLVIASVAVMSVDATDFFQNTMANSDYKAVGNGSFLSATGLEELLSYSGIPEGMMDFLTSMVAGVNRLISLSGVQTIILLAALQSVPPSLYEAAIVDGATAWERFWLITFFMISPMLLLCVIYTIIDSFTGASNHVLSVIRLEMLKNMKMGLSSAMSWIYFVLISVIILVLLLLFSKRVFYYDQ